MPAARKITFNVSRRTDEALARIRRRPEEYTDTQTLNVSVVVLDLLLAGQDDGSRLQWAHPDGSVETLHFLM